MRQQIKGNWFLWIALTLTLAGCATPYQRRNIWGEGYTELRLSQDLYTVRFWGNQHTNEQLAQEHLYRRAAELTLRHRCRFFQVIDSSYKKTEKGILYELTARVLQKEPPPDAVAVDAEFYLRQHDPNR